MKKISLLFPQTISQRYHQGSKIKIYEKSDKNQKWPVEWIDVNYKGYPRFDRIKLLAPAHIRNQDFEKVLINRQSRRDVDGTPLSFQELSDLLYFSGGKKMGPIEDNGSRTYPSAGSRYPLEVYSLVLSVKNIKAGLYHYHIKSHSLESLWLGKKPIEAVLEAVDQPWLKKCSVIFIISAIFWRTQIKYGERGYRFALLEAGHLCQNFYLVSEAFGFSACEVGGFIDDKLHETLDLSDLHEAVVVLMGVGKSTKFGKR